MLLAGSFLTRRFLLLITTLTRNQGGVVIWLLTIENEVFRSTSITEASVQYKYNAEVNRKVIIKSVIVPD